MGIGCGVFLVDDNDSLKRISMAHLDRLPIWFVEKVCPNTLGSGYDVPWHLQIYQEILSHLTFLFILVILLIQSKHLEN
jgi:hypothetical protein